MSFMFGMYSGGLYELILLEEFGALLLREFEILQMIKFRMLIGSPALKLLKL